jgi:hypothetical protein
MKQLKKTDRNLELQSKTEAELAIRAWARTYLRKTRPVTAEPSELPPYRTYRLPPNPTPTDERALEYCQRRSREEGETKSQ